MFEDTNPYKLRIEIVQEEKHFYVSFLSSEKEKVETEVTAAIAEMLFQKFVRTERNLKRSDERNLEHSELTEQALHQRALHQPKPLEDEVFTKLQKELLWKAIETLPNIQRRRVILYYFEGFTYEQIARIEGCSFRAVKYSVDCAKDKLKNIFKIF